MKNVLELLERTAARLPRQTAFADQQCSYDYQTVVNIAGSVGSALAANGDRNCPVAVLMERGAPCLVTLMGVLYSGNFYVVLDPEMPAERVNKILRTLQPTALICDEAHKDDPAGLDYDGKVYSAEALAAGQAQPELLQTVRRRMIDTDPAYAIFTSGSTGNPQGRGGEPSQRVGVFRLGGRYLWHQRKDDFRQPNALLFQYVGDGYLRYDSYRSAVTCDPQVVFLFPGSADPLPE